MIDKQMLFEQVLGVEEYFLFDPYGEFLQPPLQGFRLIEGSYAPIQPVDGRLPSEVLGLHLERDACWLRLYDPVQQRRLPTWRERAIAAESVLASLSADVQRIQAEQDRGRDEVRRLRQMVEELQRQRPSAQ